MSDECNGFCKIVLLLMFADKYTGSHLLTRVVKDTHTHTHIHVQFLFQNVKSGKKSQRKEMFLTTHSTHFIYGYTASDIW